MLTTRCADHMDLLDNALRTELLQKHLDAKLTVTSSRALRGGMVNQVEAWNTGGEPSCVVAKLTEKPTDPGFRNEYETLSWYRERTSFPVPEPLALIEEDEAFSGTILLMRYIEGANLGNARLSASGQLSLEQQMADCLVELHTHQRDTYGNALGGQTYPHYLDIFRPALTREIDAVGQHFPGHELDKLQHILATLEQRLPECGEPRLVHGDLWATNIMVDDRDSHQPQLTAFVDAGANFRDVEQELAYLLVFNTVGEAFFERYSQTFPLRPGFLERAKIYWLNTWLLHVRMFGTGYLGSAKRTLSAIQD